MTTGPGDEANAFAVPGGLARRGLLVMAVGTAVATATAVARPAGAQAAGSLVTGSEVVGDWFEQVVAATASFTPPGFPAGVADRMWAISWMCALAALEVGAARSWTAGQRSRFATRQHPPGHARTPDRRGSGPERTHR